jgi:hypothetical protein
MSQGIPSNLIIKAEALPIWQPLPTAQLSPWQSITPSQTVLVVVALLPITGAFQSMVKVLAVTQ